MNPQESKPNIAYEGDGDLAHFYLPQAKQLLGRVLEQMRFTPIRVLRGHLRLSDSAYCYAVVAGGVSSIRIVVDEVQAIDIPVSLHWKTPDFLSGVIVKGFLNATPTGTSYCDSFLPTPECGRLFKLNAKGLCHLQPSSRLAVRGYSGIADDDPADPQQKTQYAVVRPTMWTGTMRACVQALMGYGKPGKKSIYGGSYTPPPDPADTVKIPPKPDKPSVYERQVAEHGRQIRYDYKFFRTHGLSKGADGTWWLVEIGMTRGVAAMPLPLYTDTQSKINTPTAVHFRARVNKLNDGLARKVIDTFGGFPTGETFPGDPEEFDAWVRAGKILKLLPKEGLADFYNHQSYSTVMGWAFSETGQEAHNTAWQFGADGVIVGIHDCIALSFGAQVAPKRSAADVDGLVKAFKPVQKSFPKRFNAAIWKLRRLARLDYERVVSEMNDWGILAAFILLDGLIAEPLAPASAQWSRMEAGPLFYQAKPQGQPQLKFPEPVLNGIVSFDFRPLDDYTGPPVACDTLVHVFFHGDTLHWVRYFYTPITSPSSSVNSIEDCMFIGSWSSESKTEQYMPPMFYTDAFDDRKEVAGSQTTVQVSSEDLGYTHAVVGDDPEHPNYSSLMRAKTFLKTTVSETKQGPGLRSAVAVPLMDRASYYYAVEDGFAEQHKTIGYSYENLGDPNIAYGYRILHGYSEVDIIPECGNSRNRRCFETAYISDACCELADSGPWVNKCDIFENMAYAVDLPELPATKTERPNSLGKLAVVLVCDSQWSTVLVAREDIQEDQWFSAWFRMSPDDAGGYQWLWTTHNCLGDIDLVQYAKSPAGERDIIGELGFAELGVNSLITFVGVAE
jgi:hypothetical protein